MSGGVSGSSSSGGGGFFMNPATGFITPAGNAAMASINAEQQMSATMWNELFIGQLLPLIFGIQNPAAYVAPGPFPGTISGTFSAEQPGGIGGTSLNQVPGQPGGPPVDLGGVGGLGPSMNIQGVTAQTDPRLNVTPPPGSPVLEILQQAFDPQHALYKQQLGQLEQQTETELASRGIGSTPYGAAVLGNALGNFNIDWQNNLLNRMGTGLQDVLGAYGAAMGIGSESAQPMEVAGQTAADVFRTASQAQSDLNATTQKSREHSSSFGVNAGK